MKELSDENVYVQDVGHIFFLDIAKNIKEPFEAFMTRTHPQEIDLRNCNIIDSKTSYEYIYPELFNIRDFGMFIRQHQKEWGCFITV